MTHRRLAIAFLALYATAENPAAAQSTLPPVIVTAPMNSPTYGPSTQLISMFMNNIVSYYPTATQSNSAICSQQTIIALDLQCNVAEATTDIEQYLRADVFGQSLLAASGRVEFSWTVGGFAEYLQYDGIAGGINRLIGDARDICRLAYDGMTESQCISEAEQRIARPFGQGGLSGMDQGSADQAVRGQKCQEVMEMIEEFCG